MDRDLKFQGFVFFHEWLAAAIISHAYSRLVSNRYTRANAQKSGQDTKRFWGL